jgi:hypothetical protein
VHSYVYDKTDKGREEIATRKYHVAPKLRTLLVMIDGRHSLGELLKNVAGMGLTEESVNELLDQQYITLVSGGEAANEPEGPAEGKGASPARLPPSAAARARLVARNRAAAAMKNEAQDGTPSALLDAAGPSTILMDEVLAAEPVPAVPVVPEVAADAVTQFHSLYDFYNQTIKSTLGLRGMLLQLKAEKCANIADFAALRQPYLEAVLKARGREMTLSLRDRLDQLLGGRPSPDPVALD